MIDHKEVHRPMAGYSIQLEEGTHYPKDVPPINNYSCMFKHWRWWLLVAFNIACLLVGQTMGILLGGFYFNNGGNSMWTATLVQTAGFPLQLIPLLFFPATTTVINTKIAIIYILIGLMIAGDNLMYAYGLLYLPLSTYSLICATQLAFNVIFSYFLNSQKFTHLIFNSVVLLTFSATLLGVRSDSTDNLSKQNFPLGFVLTIGASATTSLILSLTQLTFQKVLKRETFSVVLQLQLCTSLVASCASLVGLFVSGEWKGLKGEMEGFGAGRVPYMMTLVGSIVSWQVSSVGAVGLAFVVSSLFSGVISTLALPVVPILAMIFFHDKMDGVKVVSMLMALWGFLSYIYQHYLDDLDDKKAPKMSEAKWGYEYSTGFIN